MEKIMKPEMFAVACIREIQEGDNVFHGSLLQPLGSQKCAKVW